MSHETRIVLIATAADPVAAAFSVTFGPSSGDSPGGGAVLRQVEPDDFAPDALGLRSTDVVLVGDSGAEAVASADISHNRPGLVQFLGCRPPVALVGRLADAGSVVAGISPVIAPRVANRVAGFAGPLAAPIVAHTDGAILEWGVVGLGVTGTAVVRKLRSGEAPVGVADVRTPPTGALAELGIRRHTLDLLVAGSDVITLHVHPGPTASPVISGRELGLMKHGAVLINTSHSSVVDEHAVLDALASGSLGGYATDCPGGAVAAASESLISSGRLIVTTNPLTDQIGAAQQIAKFVTANVQTFLAGDSVAEPGAAESGVRGKIELLDFPKIGDPSFWSSRMGPRR